MHTNTTTVTLSEAASEAIRLHAQQCYPEECCGALFGSENRIESAMALGNAAKNRTRAFAVTAGDYLKSARMADRQGCELLGFYHSHVDAPAIPSALDLGSSTDHALMVIVPVWNGVAGEPRIYFKRTSLLDV